MLQYILDKQDEKHTGERSTYATLSEVDRTSSVRKLMASLYLTPLWFKKAELYTSL